MAAATATRSPVPSSVAWDWIAGNMRDCSRCGGIAETDALITAFETKYHYNFWRPVTAIRWADDGNRRTEPDPGWLSYQLTPPYPDYICGLPLGRRFHH